MELEGKKENFRALIAIPTGGGKTRLAVTWAINRALARDRKVLWLANSQYLLGQAYYEFCASLRRTMSEQEAQQEEQAFILIHSGEGGRKRSELTSRHRLVVCSFQSLWDIRREMPRKELLDCIGDAVLIIDEAHHAVAKSYLAVAQQPQFKMVMGLTATPLRSKSHETGELLRFFCDSPGYRVHMSQLIQEKYLVHPVFETEAAKDEPEESQTGRLEDGEVEALLGDAQGWQRQLNGHILRTWWNRREHHGKTVIFARDIEHAGELFELFQRAQAQHKADKGPVFQVHSGAPGQDAQFSKFKNSPNGTLINVNMLREGVDIPDIQSVFLGCEIGSYIVATQIVGRALRPVPGEDPSRPRKNHAYIVNFAAAAPEKKVLFDMPRLAYDHYKAECDEDYARAEALETLESSCGELREQVQKEQRDLPISACCLAGYYEKLSHDVHELLVTVTLRDYRRLEMFRKGQWKGFPKRLDLFKGDMEELKNEFTAPRDQDEKLRFVPIDEELVACLELLPGIAQGLRKRAYEQQQKPAAIFKQIWAIWNDPQGIPELARRYLEHIGIHAGLFTKLVYTEFAYADEIHKEQEEAQK